MQEQPDVYPAFVRIALEMRRRGRERYSADGIGHVLRWENLVAGRADDFKVNNNYIAMLARKAMDENPELSGFFETRRMRRGTEALV